MILYSKEYASIGSGICLAIFTAVESTDVLISRIGDCCNLLHCERLTKPFRQRKLAVKSVDGVPGPDGHWLKGHLDYVSFKQAESGCGPE